MRDLLSDNSCGGQPASVEPLTLDGTTAWIYQCDLWDHGNLAEPDARTYLAPLAFDAAGLVRPLSCDRAVPVP